MSKRKRTIKILKIILGLMVFGLIVWYLGSIFVNWQKVYQSDQGQSIIPKINSKLKGEADGRVNILFLGIGGGSHPGANLTDTIIIASINTKEKKMALISIPRDLQVSIEGAGLRKINEAYASGEQNKKISGGGQALLRKTITNTFGIPIHYYIRIDFDAFRKFVDVLGGVTVNVEKSIKDPYYPATDMIHYDPFSINVGVQTLDGNTALKYARSRETTSDFDRAKRQQQLLEVIKEKALSLGILANPAKVSQLIKILGDHVRTDLSLQEMVRLVELINNIPQGSIINKVLDPSGTNGAIVEAGGVGGFYLRTKSGNFTDIQKIIQNIFQLPSDSQSDARIEVINKSGKSGSGSIAAAILKEKGYQITKITKSSEVVSKTIIYDYSNGKKSQVSKYLASEFSAEVKQVKSTDNSADFALIVGQDYHQ